MTGFYVNGGIGYGIWAADTHTINPDGNCDECTNQIQGGKGWLAAVGGFDYQLSSKIVAGVFASTTFRASKARTGRKLVVCW